MWSTILSSIIETNHGNKDTGGNSDCRGNNKQQSTKSSGGNGDGIGNDDSNDDDNENEGSGGVCGSAALTVAAGQRQMMGLVARLVARTAERLVAMMTAMQPQMSKPHCRWRGDVKTPTWCHRWTTTRMTDDNADDRQWHRWRMMT